FTGRQRIGHGAATRAWHAPGRLGVRRSTSRSSRFPPYSQEPKLMRKHRFGLLLALTAIAGAILVAATSAVGQEGKHSTAHAATGPATAAGGTYTPIKHVVVIFQENVSFDHYFGTYPNAANTSGPTFTAPRNTPAVDGLSGTLLTANPNGVNPRRYDPAAVADVLTCDQDHNYNDEQRAF